MGPFWENSDIIRALLTASTLIPATLFLSAGFWHFGGKHRGGTNLVTLTSFITLGSIGYAIWSQTHIGIWPVIGISLQILSVFLFGWCIGISGKNTLGLALDQDRDSQRLITDGPYSLVRHPFYTSYIIFWIGGVAVASSIFTLLVTLALIAIYIYTARREDKVLAENFKDEFPKWRDDTGAFFPRWR